MTQEPFTLHASCVAWRTRALLILGRSGAGKSSLALELMALGADLVADDQVILRREGEALYAGPAPRLQGLIEARGLGLLRAPWRAPVGVALALDLNEIGSERLPQTRTRVLLGAPIAAMLRPQRLSAAAVLAVLRHGPPLNPQAPLMTQDPER